MEGSPDVPALKPVVDISAAIEPGISVETTDISGLDGLQIMQELMDFSKLMMSQNGLILVESRHRNILVESLAMSFCYST